MFRQLIVAMQTYLIFVECLYNSVYCYLRIVSIVTPTIFMFKGTHENDSLNMFKRKTKKYMFVCIFLVHINNNILVQFILLWSARMRRPISINL